MTDPLSQEIFAQRRRMMSLSRFLLTPYRTGRRSDYPVQHRRPRTTLRCALISLETFENDSIHTFCNEVLNDGLKRALPDLA